jgi:DNA-binding Lrp family transcriptional regulator
MGKKRRRPVQPKVKAFVLENPGSWNSREVANAVDIAEPTVRSALDRLVSNGELKRITVDGRYRWTAKAKVVGTIDTEPTTSVEFVGLLEDGTVVVRDNNQALYRAERI